MLHHRLEFSSESTLGRHARDLAFVHSQGDFGGLTGCSLCHMPDRPVSLQQNAPNIPHDQHSRDEPAILCSSANCMWQCSHCCETMLLGVNHPASERAASDTDTRLPTRFGASTGRLTNHIYSLVNPCGLFWSFSHALIATEGAKLSASALRIVQHDQDVFIIIAVIVLNACTTSQRSYRTPCTLARVPTSPRTGVMQLTIRTNLSSFTTETAHLYYVGGCRAFNSSQILLLSRF
jgi:hypothetical protein